MEKNLNNIEEKAKDINLVLTDMRARALFYVIAEEYHS